MPPEGGAKYVCKERIIMRATKIKMKTGSKYSNDLLEIDEIYITGCINLGHYKKALVHDCVKESPGAIQVDIWPYPNVIDAVSRNGEKYVRSSPNSFGNHNLLCVPRE
jgi:hypothetical protein